jgi:hypothetical protein
MLLRRSLEAGLITGVVLAVLAVVFTFSWFVLRPIWPLVFTPVVVTGICAVARGGRAIRSTRGALLAGALAGLAATVASVIGLSVGVSFQAAIPNWPYPDAPQGSPGAAYELVPILTEAPVFLPRNQAFLDLSFNVPFPWPYTLALPDGRTIARFPIAWVWFFLIGHLLAALQAALYFLAARPPWLTGRVVDGLARYRASFYHKLMLGFALLGGLIFLVGWLGFAAIEDMHASAHQGRLIAHWLDHTVHLQSRQRLQVAAVHRLAGGDQGALEIFELQQLNELYSEA